MEYELDHEKLRRIMDACGLSQAALADKLGVSRRAVKSWVKDRTPIPELYKRLCQLLRVPEEELKKAPFQILRTGAPANDGQQKGPN